MTARPCFSPARSAAVGRRQRLAIRKGLRAAVFRVDRDPQKHNPRPARRDGRFQATPSTLSAGRWRAAGQPPGVALPVTWIIEGRAQIWQVLREHGLARSRQCAFTASAAFRRPRRARPRRPRTSRSFEDAAAPSGEAHAGGSRVGGGFKAAAARRAKIGLFFAAIRCAGCLQSHTMLSFSCVGLASISPAVCRRRPKRSESVIAVTPRCLKEGRAALSAGRLGATLMAPEPADCAKVASPHSVQAVTTRNGHRSTVLAEAARTQRELNSRRRSEPPTQRGRAPWATCLQPMGEPVRAPEQLKSPQLFVLATAISSPSLAQRGVGHRAPRASAAQRTSRAHGQRSLRSLSTFDYGPTTHKNPPSPAFAAARPATRPRRTLAGRRHLGRPVATAAARLSAPRRRGAPRRSSSAQSRRKAVASGRRARPAGSSGRSAAGIAQAAAAGASCRAGSYAATQEAVGSPLAGTLSSVRSASLDRRSELPARRPDYQTRCRPATHRHLRAGSSRRSAQLAAARAASTLCPISHELARLSAKRA